MDPDLQQPGNAPLPKQDLFMSPSLPPEINPEKPKSKKKLLFIGVGAVVLLLFVGVIFMQTNKRQSPDQLTQEQPVMDSTTVNLANQFFNYLKQDDVASAVKMLQPEKHRTQQEAIKVLETVNYLKLHYLVDQCATQGSISQNTVVTYTCKSSKGGEAAVQFGARTSNGQQVLTDVLIINETDKS